MRLRSTCAAANPEGTSRLQSARPVRRVAWLGSFAEAKEHAARFLPPGALDWLPDARACFSILAE
jgi:hypothetical protein